MTYEFTDKQGVSYFLSKKEVRDIMETHINYTSDYPYCTDLFYKDMWLRRKLSDKERNQWHKLNIKVVGLSDRLKRIQRKMDSLYFV